MEIQQQQLSFIYLYIFSTISPYSGRQVVARLKDRKVILLPAGQGNLANKQAESKP